MLSVGRNGALVSIFALGFALGGIVACGSSTAEGRRLDAGSTGPDAGLSPPTAGSGSSGLHHRDGGVGASLEDDGGDALAELDAQPDAPPSGPGCVANGLGCTSNDGGAGCCYGSCTSEMCGSCLAEGANCTVGLSGQVCCGGLTCNDGACGTNLCVPDTTPCTDPSVVCCNDNCNNGACGG